MLAGPTDRPDAKDTELCARLQRFMTLVVGPTRDAQTVLAHCLAETADHEAAHGPADLNNDLFIWTIVVRSCRARLDPDEASRVWETARAAEHLWADPGYTVSPDIVATACAEPGWLTDTLQTVPVVDRIALLLHDVEGMPPAEVAAVMRSPEDVAVGRVRRGLLAIVAALASSSLRPAGAAAGSAEPDASDCARLRRGETGWSADDHLADCSTCADLIAALERLRAQLGDQPLPSPADRVLSAFASVRS